MNGAADSGHDAPRVLLVPFTYFPDPCGGTEIYVQGLARELAGFGYAPSVAAPGARAARYAHEGVAVRRFVPDPAPRLDYAYGAPDPVAAQGFRAILEELRPAIVHLHARTAAVSDLLVDIAHEAGARAVFTYHTPTVSCARGTMMLFGATPCDGLVETRRCVACALNAGGAPVALAHTAAALPEPLLRGLAGLERLPRGLSHLRKPGLIAANGERFARLMAKVDHVVAVCGWVREALLTNGVAPEKITLSRQGVEAGAPLPPRSPRAGPLRIAYFGRIDRAKGPDLLAQALTLASNVSVAVDLYAIRQSGSARDFDALAAFARDDARLRVLPAVAPDQVRETMAGYDLIAVPSRWLETGPLVVLEAFAAGVPVLGAAHGGVAELVRDGVDGRLPAPNDARAWAQAIAQLAADPSALQAMRANVAPPRTMGEAAQDMAALYENLGVPAARGRPAPARAVHGPG